MRPIPKLMCGDSRYVSASIGDFMNSTLSALFHSMRPDGEHAVLGAICALCVLCLLMAAWWYGVEGAGKLVAVAERRNVSWVFVVPLLSLLGYVAGVLLTERTAVAHPSLVGAGLLGLTLFMSFCILHLLESYRAVTMCIWNVLRLGLPSPVMVSFWYLAHLSMLATCVPNAVSAMAVVVAGGVFLSIVVFTVYHRSAAWFSGVPGGRRLSIMVGHMLLSIACAALSENYPDEYGVLRIFAELYCISIIVASWLLLYTDQFADGTPVMPELHSPFSAGAGIVSGLLLAYLGYWISAAIVIVACGRALTKGQTRRTLITTDD